MTADALRVGRARGFLRRPDRGRRRDTLVRVLHDPIDGYAFGTNIPGTEQSLSIDAAGLRAATDACAREDACARQQLLEHDGHALTDCSLREPELHVDISFGRH
ncbi:MAG: hypothetical protein IPG88_12980 [Gemmatimonadetes bacterium]|nr:hypothetical protein [Gemmatimonadota bacterium]